MLKIGDKVEIVKIIEDTFSSIGMYPERKLIGKIGTVVEIDEPLYGGETFANIKVQLDENDPNNFGWFYVDELSKF